MLAPYAASCETSRGRRVSETRSPNRTEYQRDRDRIVHCAAFRRLEYKTQVFVNHEGDLFRTRLTHSVEVAQIARTLARSLQLNEDLVEAISLAHDLGHTAFGHAGQDALNDCMKPYGGFEHNIQSLRVVDVLENKYAAFQGLNLTFETREGILKHCTRAKARLLGDVGQRFLDGTFPSLEAQLANLSDEIAYNNHDIDDGLRAGLLTLEQLVEVPLFARFYHEVMDSYQSLTPKQIRHEVIRRMINYLVLDVIQTSQAALNALRPPHVDAVRQADQPLIAFSPEARRLNTELKRFLYQNLYSHHQVYRITSKARRVIKALFDAFLADPKLLPPKFADRVPGENNDLDHRTRARLIADYIAGMTDRYALDEYDRLFDPRRLR
ncbi:MAG: deoxyguanosinetriphosphate triphosphohydrolase [Abyssibacter sp.]|uniref:deoxyguanosinetriphosphate triphosphohydrolase n=1 Tax=Abyssibacter sp. TaxID=2320200 RepID=UPI00321BE68C